MIYSPIFRSIKLKKKMLSVFFRTYDLFSNLYEITLTDLFVGSIITIISVMLLVQIEIVEYSTQILTCRHAQNTKQVSRSIAVT